MGWASRYREYQAEQKAASTMGDDYGAEPAPPSGLPFGMTGAQVAVSTSAMSGERTCGHE